MNGSLIACEPAAMIALSNFTTLPDRRRSWRDFEVMRIEEFADALQHGDLPRLRHPGEPAGQFADDLFLVGAQLGEVDVQATNRTMP